MKKVRASASTKAVVIDKKIGISVRPPKVTDMIAGRIRQQIIDGELNVGDKLPPQNQLLEVFGVSRPTLREAFRILEAERLITTIRGAHGGAFINAPDPDLIRTYTILVWRSQKTTVGDLFAVRQVIEPPVARQLAITKSAQTVALLTKCLQDEHLNVHDPQLFARAVTDFHRALINQFGNHPLFQLMETINDVLQRHIPYMIAKSTRDIPADKGQLMLKRSFSLKQKLIDQIAKGDGDGAEATWQKYMELSRANWMAIYGDLTVHSLLVDEGRRPFTAPSNGHAAG